MLNSHAQLILKIANWKKHGNFDMIDDDIDNRSNIFGYILTFGFF